MDQIFVAFSEYMNFKEKRVRVRNRPVLCSV